MIVFNKLSHHYTRDNNSTFLIHAYMSRSNVFISSLYYHTGRRHAVQSEKRKNTSLTPQEYTLTICVNRVFQRISAVIDVTQYLLSAITHIVDVLRRGMYYRIKK
jgi:hypothetical protein